MGVAWGGVEDMSYYSNYEEICNFNMTTAITVQHCEMSGENLYILRGMFNCKAPEFYFKYFNANLCFTDSCDIQNIIAVDIKRNDEEDSG